MDTCWVPRPLPARVPAMTLRPDPYGDEASREHGSDGGAGEQPPRRPEAGRGRRGSRGRGRSRSRSCGDRWRRLPPRPELDLFASALSVRTAASDWPAPRAPLCPPPEGCTSGAARGLGLRWSPAGRGLSAPSRLPLPPCGWPNIRRNCYRNEAARAVTAERPQLCPFALTSRFSLSWTEGAVAGAASGGDHQYVLSVLKFTCPTLFQGYNVLAWLPASVLFVGIIYAGSRALSRLAIPMFLTLHNAAEVIICGHGMCFRKEKTPPAKICSALLLLAAAGSLPFNDAQFDPDGYFWAVIHLLCVGAYKILQKSLKPGALSDIDQQYLNYIFSVALLASAAHPTGDLLCARDFPLLYFYRFHSSCCASGLLGFLLTLSALKLKSLAAPGQCAAWLLLAQVTTAGCSVLLFEGILTRAAVGCLLLGGLGKTVLVFAERRGTPR